MSRALLGFAMVVYALLGSALASAGEAEARAARIAQLIRDLGHRDFAVRNAAEKRLTKLSWRAFPAVKEALRSRDPEIAERAQRIHGRLANATVEQQNLIRQKAEIVFDEGRYADAAELYGLLAFQDGLVVHSRLWLGHAYQLAGRWQDAVDAYRLALRRTEFLEAHPEIPVGRFVVLDRAADGGPHRRTERGGGLQGLESVLRLANGETTAGHSVVWDSVLGVDQGRASVRGWQVRVPSGTGRRPLQTLRIQANQLRLLIGLLEREEIGDLEAASRTFAGATDSRGILERTTSELAAECEDCIRKNMVRRNVSCDNMSRLETTYSCWCLKELAVTQERMGSAVKALNTWERIRLIRLRHAVFGCNFCIAREMARLVQTIGVQAAFAGDERPSAWLPEVRGVFVVSTEKKSYHLDLADPKVLARTCLEGQTDRWEFVFVSVPGQEIARLDVSCDIEQNQLGSSGQLKCWAEMEDGDRVDLGQIRWPGGSAVGRKLVPKQFVVPAGAVRVHIQSHSWARHYIVHCITVKPTLRPRAAGEVVPTCEVETETLPGAPRGIMTCDVEGIPSRSSRTGFTAGEHLFSYDVPGRTDGRRVRETFVSGARYQVFINLDSPFSSTLTNLRHFSRSPMARSSLTRLRDGRWLVAFETVKGREYSGQPKIMLSTSRDLVAWAKPWEFAHGSVFRSTAPSLLVDEEGTIWLAWLSNRLSLDRQDGESRLWLASSRDGRQWSLPVPVDCAGAPQKRTQMARAPDGRYWLFVDNWGGSAGSPGHIRRLSPIEPEEDSRAWYGTPSFAWDSQHRMHMVYLHWGGKRRVRHVMSEDGKTWGKPVTLATVEGGGLIGSLQLVLGKEGTALIHEGAGLWLTRLRPGGDATGLRRVGAATKITGPFSPGGGASLAVTPDGRVVLLVGGDTVWLFRGKLAEILKEPHGQE